MEKTLHFRAIPIKSDFSSLQGLNTQKHPQTHPNPKYIQSHHFYALKHPLETSLPFTRPQKDNKKTTDAKRHPHTPKSAFWECLAVPVGVSWCLWVSVGVCWCLLVFCVVKICLEDAWRGYQRISECFLWMFVEFRCVWGTIKCSALVMKEMALCWNCSEMQDFFLQFDTFKTYKYQNQMV